MRFTVMTPTFNRAHTLTRVFDSLKQQTFHDFEWLIIDDGSSDETALVSRFRESASFPIRYEWKSNGGKHTAMNLGVKLAAGDFVLFFDSDDRCTADALERFDLQWKLIPNPEKFSTLACLCTTADGKLFGSPYPADVVDAHTLADQMRVRGPAERWGINRTDVLRQFPFPEGERFVPEGLVWNRIARKYSARFVNEALRIYYFDPTGNTLSARMVAIRACSPNATLAYYRELCQSPVDLRVRMRATLNWVRFRTHALMGTGRS